MITDLNDMLENLEYIIEHRMEITFGQEPYLNAAQIILERIKSELVMEG